MFDANDSDSIFTGFDLIRCRGGLKQNWENEDESNECEASEQQR